MLALFCSQVWKDACSRGCTQRGRRDQCSGEWNRRARMMVRSSVVRKPVVVGSFTGSCTLKSSCSRCAEVPRGRWMWCCCGVKAASETPKAGTLPSCPQRLRCVCGRLWREMSTSIIALAVEFGVCGPCERGPRWERHMDSHLSERHLYRLVF